MINAFTVDLEDWYQGLEIPSSEWKGYERVRDFVLLPEDFTQQNDMLTPSMKIKRRNVMARWGGNLEALYRTPAAAAAKHGDGDGEGDGLAAGHV